MVKLILRNIKMNKDKRGGARKGAGRKPIKDRKIPVTLWFRPSEIKKNGGLKKLKVLMYNVAGC